MTDNCELTPDVRNLIAASRKLVRALLEDQAFQYAGLAGAVLDALDVLDAGDLSKEVPA